MEYKWLKRIVLALKRIVLALKNRFKSHDASDQKVHKYVYRRGQNAETGNLAASKEKHEKLGYNHKNADKRSLDRASWWNRVLDSRYLTLRCITGRIDVESGSSEAEQSNKRSCLFRENEPAPDYDSLDDHENHNKRYDWNDSKDIFDPETGERLPQAACEVPPGMLANSGPPKSRPPKSGSPKRFLSVFSDLDKTNEEDSESFFPHRNKKRLFTEKEYLQILEDQDEKFGKHAPTNTDKLMLPSNFVNAVDALTTRLHLTRNEFSDRSLLDVKIYDRIKRKEKWHPKADTCKAILFALRPNVITALRLYNLAGYTFRECDEDLLLLCMFGVGDYDIETYNRVMASRGLRQLGSKSKK